MQKKVIAIASLLIILTFIGYIIIDTALAPAETQEQDNTTVKLYPEYWAVSVAMPVTDGRLTSVGVSEKGQIVAGGISFVTLYDSLLEKLWVWKAPAEIKAVAMYNDTVYACTNTDVVLLNSSGKELDTFGPYEATSILTSLSVSKRFISLADAGNKLVYILNKDGSLSAMVGQGERKFLVPSPYFDAALMSDDTLFVANTGNHRVEKWTTAGVFVSGFGKPGTAPEEFNACCNPAHFAIMPQGFVTAEKGLNRIKILDASGNFTEFVSVNNKFSKPHPLDLAAFQGRIIYAANEVDSKIYIFRRK